MPLLCCPLGVLIEDLRSRLPVEYLLQNSTHADPGLSRFRGKKGLAAAFLWCLVTRFDAWLHLVCSCGDLSSESSFDLRILKYFDLLDNLEIKLSLYPG